MRRFSAPLLRCLYRDDAKISNYPSKGPLTLAMLAEPQGRVRLPYFLVDKPS
jgi:hypothetical protein